ncbi:DHH phosphoesterase [Trametes elegans]|nr:DHH phosphoesterase [Trametes elegans]
MVMGNEAGDIDSIASAVAYAWYAHNVNGTAAVSLVQTPRADLHLRAENLHALELAGLHPEANILCIDDVPPSEPFPSNRFALVDHNRLLSRFSRADPDAQVVAVVNHHADEGLYKGTADPRIVVVPTGSCASIVALLYESHPEHMTAERAALLLCSILIDTSGLKAGGKAGEADRRAASFFVPYASALDNHTEVSQLVSQAPQDIPVLQEFHTTLQGKKASVAHLNTLDLLKRDYKEYNLTPATSPSLEILVGLSTVPIGFRSWLPRHPDFWSHTEKLMAERGLTVFGILALFRKSAKNGRGKHRREQMYIVRNDEELAEKLFDALDECGELKLKRKTFPDFGVHKGFGPEICSRIWKQQNVEATRKATAPIVKDIIEGRGQAASL